MEKPMTLQDHINDMIVAMSEETKRQPTSAIVLITLHEDEDRAGGYRPSFISNMDPLYVKDLIKFLADTEEESMREDVSAIIPKMVN